MNISDLNTTVKCLEEPQVRDLLDKFKRRNIDDLHIVDVAEIVYKLITTLKVDHERGRHKEYSISVNHLGEILGIGKGVVSQYMSVWNIPTETKAFLRNYNLSLIEAYMISRIKGRDQEDMIKQQKERIISCNKYGYSNKTSSIISAVNQAKMVISSIILSYKIPQEKLKIIPEINTNKMEDLRNIAKDLLYNIGVTIEYISPKINNMEYLKKELDFCNLMFSRSKKSFCGIEITQECLEKQIKNINNEISYIEEEYKKSHISSILMMKNELEKNI